MSVHDALHGEDFERRRGWHSIEGSSDPAQEPPIGTQRTYRACLGCSSSIPLRTRGMTEVLLQPLLVPLGLGVFDLLGRLFAALTEPLLGNLARLSVLGHERPDRLLDEFLGVIFGDFGPLAPFHDEA